MISSKIDALFANSAAPTRTISEHAAEMAFARQSIDVGFLIESVIGATLFMLLFLTGNVMKLSVQERIPEFAVLKTIGYSGTVLLGLVLAESLVQCAMGAILGLSLAKMIFAMTANLLSRVAPVAKFADRNRYHRSGFLARHSGRNGCRRGCCSGERRNPSFARPQDQYRGCAGRAMNP
jgi:ABC-type antimicrobial peptide transport system permease subunit